MDLATLQEAIKEFSRERDWEQFHSVKNLILALTGEVGELAETVQWVERVDKEYFFSNPERYEEFENELADVFIYLLRIADVSGIDILKAGEKKLEKNAFRYTVQKSLGNVEKF